MISMSLHASGWPTQADLHKIAEEHYKKYFGILFRTAVKLSPVYSGAFRASWRISFNNVRADVTEGRTPLNPVRGAAFHWPSGFKLGDTIYVSNAQPYAELIEYGAWSSQAPSGVLRVAEAFADAMS